MKKIIIQINEKDYELKYDINSLIELDAAGIDVMNLDNVKFNIKNIRSMFKHAIKHQAKKITDSKTGELMSDYIAQGHDLNDISNLIMEALANSLGGTDEDNEVNEGK